MSERAWPLCVVSSGKQTDTLPHQRATLIQLAKSKGWTLERIGDFEDDDSGKKGPRKLFLRMVAEIERTPASERPRWVVMTRLDRVGRGTIAESQFLLHELNALGVGVWTADGGEEKNDSAVDEFIRSAKLFTARHENEIRIKKATDAHARKRKAGLHAGHAPYGTVLVEHRPVAYEPEAAIVREIFERRALGWGVHRLARYAAEHAVPKRKADGGVRHMKWDESTIARMLACKTYEGVVVDSELWMEVQSMRGVAIERQAKYPWPLRGAIRCTCGRMLSTAFTGPKGHRIRYYTCRNVAVHRNRYPYHRADVLEAQFVELLAYLAKNPGLHASSIAPIDIEALRTERAAVAAEIERAEARRRKVWALYEDDDVDKDEVRARLAEISDERKAMLRRAEEIDARIADATRHERSRESVHETIKNIATAWPNADIEMQRETAKAVAQMFPLYVEPAAKARESKLTLRL